MKVAIAQLDQHVGDLPGNARRILDACGDALRAGASLVVTPELSLCGYPPEDLLLRPSFLDACARELGALAAAMPSGIVVVVGFPERADGRCHNAAAVIRGGRVAQVYRKQQLPNYTVFDEERYFEPGSAPGVARTSGTPVPRRRRARRARSSWSCPTARPGTRVSTRSASGRWRPAPGRTRCRSST